MRTGKSVVLAWIGAAVIAVSACDTTRPSGGAERAPSGATRAPTPAPEAEERHVLDPMPTPVRGHFSEINTGEFDLVDGVAYRALTGETVVYVTSKPIASAALAGSPCPMTQVRFLTLLRDAGWNELAFDAKGTSSYYADGTPFGGSGREEEVGGHYWRSWLEASNGTVMGSVKHAHYGGFDFALPLSPASVPQVSQADASGGRRAVDSASKPREPQVAAAYRSARTAAMKKDLDALLRLQGFDARQVAAIRGLTGISADLARLADRFLKPGAAAEFRSGPGWASISASGVNSKSEKFINYYWFTTCGERLVLTAISENPQ